MFSMRTLYSSLFLGLLCLQLAACASYQASPPALPWPANIVQQERVHDLSNCVINERTLLVRGEKPLTTVIMINGVTASSRIYQGLAEALLRPLNAKVIMLDLPGTGGSYLKQDDYSWDRQRHCLKQYLDYQSPHILVVHDMAAAIVTPLLAEVSTIRQLVVLNAVLRPSEFELQFPVDCSRDCGLVSKAVFYSTPFYLYESRFRRIGIRHDARVDSAQIRAIYDELNRKGGKQRLLKLVKGFELNSQSDQKIILGLAHQLPQLFVWGQADPVLGGELEQLPDGAAWRTVVRLNQAKHFLMLDHKQQVAQAIIDWYSELDP